MADNGDCRGAFRRRLESEHSIQGSLLTRRYPPPLLEVPLPRKTGGEGLLRIPAVLDRVVRSAAYLLTRDRY